MAYAKYTIQKRHKMKKYKIERLGNFEHPMFIFTLYSKNKPIRFLLDSGCDTNAIFPSSLKHCELFETGMIESNITGNGIIESTVMFISVKLSRQDTPFALSVRVLDSQVEKAFICYNCHGLLGAQFMQCCKIDFRNLWIEIPERGGAFSLLTNAGKYLSTINK